MKCEVVFAYARIGILCVTSAAKNYSADYSGISSTVVSALPLW